MPEPVRAGQRYVPGLDGLRALAVLAVLAYHLNLGWAQGGLLGVGVFFTLSGYLITDLLLGQLESTGSLQLADFWMRRARRLLPALFVMLAVVVAWVTLLDRSQLAAIREAVASAAAYVSNWWLIAQHHSYFARFGPPSPLGHLWSLAVEEQFYLLWPWLLWLGLRWRRCRSVSLARLAAAALLLAAASAAAMALLYHPGYDPTRAYDGTDTRAFALLIGAALAFVWPSRHLRGDVTQGARRILDGAGVAGLAVIAALIWRTTEYSAFLYRGGMVLLSAAVALVVGAAVSPASSIGRALGWRPLRWIGVRSYGIYLWHFPVIVLTSPADGRETLTRGTLQVAASIGAAALSWRFVEEPVRQGALGRWRAQARSVGWRLAAGGRHIRLTLAGTAVVSALAIGGLTGVVQPAAAGLAAGSPASASTSRARALSDHSPARHGHRRAGSLRHLVSRPRRLASLRRTATRGPVRSACRAVVHIGDSTSDGLISPNYLPDPRQRIAAQYARVGVARMITEISGGRSIVETLDHQPNADTVARDLVRGGYRGCWVLALGTNDTADVDVGSSVGRAVRIRQMMSVLGRQPVMWVNVKSLVASGPYSESNMLLWDSALVQACARYPNMRVYDWAEVARSRWFISDGIHFTSAGYAARAHLIARALASAFPAQMARAAAKAPVRPRSPGSPSCLVH